MDVTEHLEALQEKYDAVSVERPIPLEFNLRLLEAYDMNPVESTTNEGLMEWTREGCQLLVNALFSLETESNDAGIFAKLPDAVHFLPRMKPVPKQKAQTRWEKFAAAKGIQKRKKVRVQYDENHGEYRPTWGYKNQGSKEKDLSEWIKEVPVNGDQTEDQYEKARAQKKERVEKNEMQQRRNTEEAYAQEKGKDFRAFKKKQLEKQIVESKTATASMGKFDNKIQGDNVKIRKQKRQFESNTKPVASDKDKLLEIASKVGQPGSKVNVRKAVKLARQTTERQNAGKRRK